MTKGAGGVYSTVWEAFGISDEDNSRFKIVVSDGDKETEIYTDYFKVLEKAPVKEYLVVFKDKDGNVLKEEKVKAGSSVQAPEAPIVEGYEFTGWDKEFNSVTEDLTITALYKQIENNNQQSEKSGCKKDLALVVVSLISLSTMALMIFKKEK
jgi:hypothetical protein